MIRNLKGKPMRRYLMVFVSFVCLFGVFFSTAAPSYAAQKTAEELTKELAEIEEGIADGSIDPTAEPSLAEGVLPDKMPAPSLPPGKFSAASIKGFSWGQGFVIIGAAGALLYAGWKMLWKGNGSQMKAEGMAMIPQIFLALIIGLSSLALVNVFVGLV